MREKRKDPILKYGFLFDRDSSKAASLLPVRRGRTIAKAGLPDDATDDEICAISAFTHPNPPGKPGYCVTIYVRELDDWKIRTEYWK